MPERQQKGEPLSEFIGRFEAKPEKRQTLKLKKRLALAYSEAKEGTSRKGRRN